MPAGCAPGVPTIYVLYSLFAKDVVHIRSELERGSVMSACRWRPVLQSWLDKLPAGVTAAHKTLLLSLFDWLIPPCLRIATKLVKPVLQIVDINLVCSCMRLFQSHLDLFRWATRWVALHCSRQQLTWLYIMPVATFWLIQTAREGCTACLDLAHCGCLRPPWCMCVI